MSPDHRRRLSTLLHDASVLALEMRAARGEATGEDKTTIRAVLIRLERATMDLLAAQHRASIDRRGARR